MKDDKAEDGMARLWSPTLFFSYPGREFFGKEFPKKKEEEIPRIRKSVKSSVLLIGGRYQRWIIQVVEIYFLFFSFG